MSCILYVGISLDAGSVSVFSVSPWVAGRRSIGIFVCVPTPEAKICGGHCYVFACVLCRINTGSTVGSGK